MINSLPVAPVDAFTLMANTTNPKILFRIGIKELDDLIGGQLCLGEIFEICGIRHTAKSYVAHSILANILTTYTKDDSFRIIVLDYSNQFSTTLLIRLIRTRSEMSDEEIDQLLENVLVTRVSNWRQLHFTLRRLMETVSEERLWKCHELQMPMTNTVVFISDIGSLLQATSYQDQREQLIQDKAYQCLDHLARGGAFVLLLNQCVDKDDQKGPPTPMLGRNWRKLIKRRLLLARDESREEDQHIGFVIDPSERTSYACFKLR